MDTPCSLTAMTRITPPLAAVDPPPPPEAAARELLDVFGDAQSNQLSVGQERFFESECWQFWCRFVAWLSCEPALKYAPLIYAWKMERGGVETLSDEDM
eukprot:1241046-Rhodomonas_salina.2